MDAIHFRLQAAHAREMAKSGDDLRLSRMLLDVARDLDAEADAMEVEVPAARNPPAAAMPPVPHDARSHASGGDTNIVSAEIIDLAIYGAKIRTDSLAGAANTANPGVQDYALHLEGTISRR